MGIGAIELFSSVQVVGHESYAYASADEEWGFAVWSAATGQIGGFVGYADVDGDGGVEAESWRGNRQLYVGILLGELLRTLVQDTFEI